MDLTTLSLDDLAALATETKTKFDALIALDAPTDEQVAEAEAHAQSLDDIAAEQTKRQAASDDKAERLSALRSRFSADQAAGAVEAAAEGDGDEDEDAGEEDAEDGDSEGDGDGEAGDGGEAQAATAPVKKVAASTGSRVAAVARKSTRPLKPAAAQSRPVSITAAADVPGFATGSAIDTMDRVGDALISRMRGFPTPSGNGETEDLRHYGVAQFHLDVPDTLTINRPSDENQEILERAAKEARLPGGSLVASGGWCAPSETIYDLCTTETTEGIISLPEVGVKRGGIKFTSGPDFSAVYAAASGFDQTEAQAIAGTTKACFEVPCPSFTDVRLDAVGICIKAPLLTQAAYPELVRRWLDGTTIAHQHRVNAKVIGKMVTAAGAARVYDAAAGTTAGATLDALELITESLREKFAMSLTATMEVILPAFAKGMLRADMSKRTGRDATDPITDQMLAAEFAARHLNVQWAYDWQNVGGNLNTVIAYPATFQALVYPAGTFVKGMDDVITLNAVYDAASLAVNVYTALFMEQGVLVAQMCNQAALVTLPVCNNGRTGAANLTCP